MKSVIAAFTLLLSVNVAADFLQGLSMVRSIVALTTD